MNLAETWGMRDRHTNPCEDIERYPERKRERFLSDTELQRLGSVLAQAECEQTEGRYAVAAFRLLLLTGCRLSETVKLEWRHVNIDSGELHLPDSKTGAKTVHLGESAAEVLRDLPRVARNPYVIVGKREGSYLSDLQHPWRRLRAAAGLDGVRIHDLRHTFASGGLAVGEGLSMIGKLLGHTQIQTSARYAHLASDPMKAAANKISDRLASALYGAREEPASKIPAPEQLTEQLAPAARQNGDRAVACSCTTRADSGFALVGACHPRWIEAEVHLHRFPDWIGHRLL